VPLELLLKWWLDGIAKLVELGIKVTTEELRQLGIPSQHHAALLARCTFPPCGASHLRPKIQLHLQRRHRSCQVRLLAAAAPCCPLGRSSAVGSFLHQLLPELPDDLGRVWIQRQVVRILASLVLLLLCSA